MPEIAEVRFESKLKTVYEGQLVLPQVLRHRADPLDLWRSSVVVLLLNGGAF